MDRGPSLPVVPGLEKRPGTNRRARKPAGLQSRESQNGIHHSYGGGPLAPLNPGWDRSPRPAGFFCKRTSFKLDKNNTQIVIGTGSSKESRAAHGSSRYFLVKAAASRSITTFRYRRSCPGYRNPCRTQNSHSRIFVEVARDATASTLWSFYDVDVMPTCVKNPTRRTR